MGVAPQAANLDTIGKDALALAEHISRLTPDQYADVALYVGNARRALVALSTQIARLAK